MLASARQLINQAQKDKFILPTFNTSNLEVSQAIVRGAVAKKAPVEIQASESAIAYAGLETLVAMIKSLTEEYREVPVALHLDHGRHYKTVTAAIKAGFSSVQYDGSSLPFEENVKMTKKVAEFAHDFGIVCQGELGAIPKAGLSVEESGDEQKIVYTDPEEAALFVKLTGVDTLAVSVGNAHGIFKNRKPEIDFDRLGRIRDKVSVPLVIHGGSGISPEDFKKMMDYNVAKVNIDTELRLAFMGAIRKILAEDKQVIDPRDVLAVGRAAVQAVVQEKIEVFGATGRAQIEF